MSVLPDQVLSRILMRISETFHGLSLGYELAALNAVEPDEKVRAEAMHDAFEIAAATLEETAKREAE